MTPKSCFTILHVSILAATLLTLEVSCIDECHVQIKVRRYTEYKALLGEELKIDCPVTFCDDTPPEIYWDKLQQTYVPVNISRGSRFKSEWKTIKPLEGVSVLIIQNFVRNDSGVYWCGSSSSLGHKIKVSVNVLNSSPTNRQLQSRGDQKLRTLSGLLCLVLLDLWCLSS
ncbi:B- and T-lymphocyte attenuator-like isoform X2 [Labrus mixtus]|uniref:B- and T-lymphocyte attenuator-like isoform X2 n=1 Tax=Labrus mixtus TaxID=508554 RepID=UPI0029C01577|nr:B- and T-lymphocyte attenuator-like isoform X2 [Labrus mixtus]